MLIDGDGMPFLDSLVGAGIDGDESAERMLRQNIAFYCTQLRVFSENNDSILIRVFANVGNFANAYDLSDGPRGSDYRSFVLGFNRANKFSEYIDVGNNKEAADTKIKATTDLMIHNAHCRHVILGVCSDQGYNGFLSDYLSRDRSNLSMVEWVPFATHLRKTAESFHTLRVDEVFRTEAMQKTQNPRPRNATISDGMQLDLLRYGPVPSGRIQAQPVVFLDGEGRRIDTKIPYIDKSTRDILSNMLPGNRRFCNNHYLRLHCPMGDNCSNEHNIVLDMHQLNALKFVARTIRCRDTKCLDPSCTYGHSLTVDVVGWTKIFEYNVVTQDHYEANRKHLVQDHPFG